MDGFARVVAATVNVRTAPSVHAPLVTIAQADGAPLPARVGTATEDTHVYLLDGPTDADGYTWYRVAPTEGEHSYQPQFTGWMAGGDGTDTWLVVEHPCPTGAVDLADITLTAASWAVRVGCFPDRQLTLRGWYPDRPADEPTPEPCYAEPAFLICLVHDIRPIEMSFYDPRNANRLDFAADPAVGLVMPTRGQWIEITGSFNYPASEQCSTDSDLGFLPCGAVFVISSVRPIGSSA